MHIEASSQASTAAFKTICILSAADVCRRSSTMGDSASEAAKKVQELCTHHKVPVASFPKALSRHFQLLLKEASDDKNSTKKKARKM